jgi:hypothetical protein
VIKTCALCQHCDINLGYEGWSQLTPACEGSISCDMINHDSEIGVVFKRSGLVGLAVFGSKCPDFQLMQELA